MKGEEFLKFLLLLACLVSLSVSSPLRLRQLRKRRDDDDFGIMNRYWNEPIPLGFFVNEGAAETGDGGTEQTGLELRDKIAGIEGSGGQHDGHHARAEVPKPSRANIMRQVSKVTDDAISEETTGSLKASITKESDVSSDPAEPKRKLRSSVTCEGQKEWLQCDGPYELIKIKNAFWGRDDSHTCTRSGVTHGLHVRRMCAQDEQNTMTKVREACDNENVCEVVASPIYFDKTDCADVYKFLRMEWECAPSESRIKETIDNDKAR